MKKVSIGIGNNRLLLLSHRINNGTKQTSVATTTAARRIHRHEGLTSGQTSDIRGPRKQCNEIIMATTNGTRLLFHKLCVLKSKGFSIFNLRGENRNSYMLWPPGARLSQKSPQQRPKCKAALRNKEQVVHEVRQAQQQARSGHG